MEMEVIKWKKFNEEQTVLKNGQSRSSGFTVQQILDSIKKNSIKETYDVVTSCGFNCTETDEVVVLCNYIQNDNVYLTQDILKSSIIERQKLYTKQIAPIAVNMNKPTSYDKAVGESKKFITDAIKQKNIPTVPVEVKETLCEYKREAPVNLKITNSSIRLKGATIVGTKIINKKDFIRDYHNRCGYNSMSEKYELSIGLISSIIRKLETAGHLKRNFKRRSPAPKIVKDSTSKTCFCNSTDINSREFNDLLKLYSININLYLKNYYLLSLEEQVQLFNAPWHVIRKLNAYIIKNKMVPVSKRKMVLDINNILKPYYSSKADFVKIWNRFSDVIQCANYLNMPHQLARTVADDLRLTC